MNNKKLLTYRGAVATQECDSNGHMNVMYYINKYELGGRNLMAELGVSKPYLLEHQLGVAVVEQNIKYLQEVFEDDVLYIESSVEGHTEKVMSFLHELKDGITHRMVGTMQIKIVIFDKIKRKAIKIPAPIQAKLQEQMK